MYAREQVFKLIEETGSVLIRNGKHRIYQLPNHRTFTIPQNDHPDRRVWLNSLSLIRKLAGISEAPTAPASEFGNKLQQATKGLPLPAKRPEAAPVQSEINYNQSETSQEEEPMEDATPLPTPTNGGGHLESMIAAAHASVEGIDFDIKSTEDKIVELQNHIETRRQERQKYEGFLAAYEMMMDSIKDIPIATNIVAPVPVPVTLLKRNTASRENRERRASMMDEILVFLESRPNEQASNMEVANHLREHGFPNATAVQVANALGYEHHKPQGGRVKRVEEGIYRRVHTEMPTRASA
jgi:predicted RNA binding protein YcfA (HicA-like mRNA interferase family)